MVTVLHALSPLDCGKQLCPFHFTSVGLADFLAHVVCVCVCVCVFQEGKKKRKEGGNIQASYTDDTHFVLLNSDSASWLSHLNQLLCFVLLYEFLKRKALWSLQAR